MNSGLRCSPIDQRLVHERAQLSLIIEGSRRKQLGHVDDHQLFGWIDPVDGMVRTAPPELADRAGDPPRSEIGDDGESETKSLSGPERDAVEMIHRHQLHGRATEDSRAIQDDRRY